MRLTITSIVALTASLVAYPAAAQDRSGMATFDYLNKLERGAPYAEIRKWLVTHDWQPLPRPDQDTCGETAWVCSQYAELSNCWTEDAGDRFCDMFFVDDDPLGSELRIIVLLEETELTFDIYFEQAKGGRG